MLVYSHSKNAFNDETTMKKLTKIILPLTFLLGTSFAHADQTEINRAKSLASYMILALSPKNNEGKDNIIKFTAAIANISNAEAAKRINESPSIPMPAEQLKASIFEEITDPKDQKLVGSAIDNFINAQSDILRSCQVQPNVTQPDANSYNIPLKCKVPNINWDNVKKPELNEKEGKAATFAKLMNWTATLLKTSPRQAFDTAILLHKEDEQLIPEMDNRSYFPGSLAKMMGAEDDSEEPAMDDQGEDAAN